MDCAFRIRREYRAGQTKSRDVRRGLPQTGREPGPAAIEVEGIPRSIGRPCSSCSQEFARVTSMSAPEIFFEPLGASLVVHTQRRNQEL